MCAYRTIFKGDVSDLNLNEAWDVIATDLPKIRAGKLGGVIWYALYSCPSLSATYACFGTVGELETPANTCFVTFEGPP